MTDLHEIDAAIAAGPPDHLAAAGFTMRGFAGPSDYVGLAAANQRSRDAAGIEEVVSAEGMARNYSHLVNCDLERDLLVVERGGVIVGYVRVEWRDLEDGTRGFHAVVMLDPVHGGSGLYAAMLQWTEERSIANARAIPVEKRRPSSLRTFSFGAEVDLAAALEASGWTRTGHGYEMVRPTLDDIPELPMPDGLEVRDVTTERASRRLVWDAATDAFRDERNEAEPTESDWESSLEDPLEDPSLWLIAFDGDEIAGGVHGRIDPEENAHHGRERGLVAAVYTRRAWRRRGLARALIARCLVRLRERGMTSAYLGVDGLNPNQATDLYSALGFEVASTTYDWTKPLPADAAPATAEDLETT
jgi:mycothiol synthase